MAISSSSATYTRFFVPEPETEDFWSFVDEKLCAGAFKDLQEGDEFAVGFSSWEDFFDPSFEGSSYHKGEYAAFSFRIDQKKVPPVVIKQHVRQALQDYKEERGGKFPSRKERQDIHENVQAMLMARAFPQASSFEVVWNPGAKWMLLGTTGTRPIDSFLEFFEEHFRVFPVPLFHVNWAMNQVLTDARQKDTLASMVSLKSGMALEEGRFLGQEFLTWLWYFAEQEQTLPAAGGKQVQIHLGERIVLTMPKEGKEKVVCTTQANYLHEARTALRQHKLVHEVQILLIVGENEYLLNLDSALWAVKGLKTPKQLAGGQEEDQDGLFLEKVYFLEEVSQAMDALFGRFLSERLSHQWDLETLPAIKAWIEAQPVAPEQDKPGSQSVDPDPVVARSSAPF